MSAKSASYSGISIWMYSPDLKSMCSPSGSLTVNSLMKVATFSLEMTSHSSFFTLRALSGTAIWMLSFTFTWHPRRQPSLICLREKKPVSVGRMVPPPSSTCSLHWPQLALPPQAEGRKMPWSASVCMTSPPGVTSSSLVPLLMLILTVPEGVRALLIQRRRATRIRVTTVMTMME